MYIKQITIQGFKSYKDQLTFAPFSPKHNVIVGRNGSGKSNFFSAIRFVLGDSFQSLNKEERQALLHEGTGSATISAYVEIVFDNSDNRFPTGNNEVVLRRSIGLTLDEYSLDKKSVLKSDVMNLLESAGFSRSNPYYIVPQGRINALTVAKDEDRLKLLKEIAGTHVYEQKRSESNKIMEETEAKLTKINEVLDYIKERLTELEEEKEELSQYQTLDRSRRSLEYTIYMREQVETNEKLEEVDVHRRRDLTNSENKRQEYLDNDKNMASLESSVRDLKQSLKFLEDEKSELQEERESIVKAKAKLELLIKDLEYGEMTEIEYQNKVASHLRSIDHEITQVEKNIADLTPRFEELRATDTQARQALRSLQAQQQNIHARQARLSRFSSKAERDEWLQTQINDLNANLTVRNNQLRILEEEKKTAEEQVSQRVQKIQAVRETLKKRQSLQQDLAEEEVSLREARDEATENRKQFWREEARLESTLKNCNEEVRKAQRILASTIDKNTANGLEAVSNITKSLNLEGVYGPIFELFDVDDRLKTAIEVAAGSSLFHVVVDTDETATRLLEVMNEQKAGRVTFIPLNRIKSRVAEFPTSNDVIPALDKIQYDARFQKAFEQIFGNVAICPNLEVAASYSKSHNLSVVTLEGDRVDRRGALFGGYVDLQHSRLDAAKKLRTWQTKLTEETKRGQEIKQEIAKLDQQVTDILSKLQVVESKKKQLQLQGDTSTYESRLRKEEDAIKQLIDGKEKSLEDIRANAASLQQQIESYQSELASEPSHTLSSEEQALLTQNSQQIEQMKQRLVEISSAKAEASHEFNTLKDRLENDLKRRREELASRKERATADSSSNELARRQKEEKRLAKKQARLTKRIAELDTEIDKQQEELQRQEQALDQLQTEQTNLSQAISKYEKNLERCLLRRSLLLQRKEEVNSNIRELGVLPEDAFEKYSSYSVNKLLRRLHRANEQLQQYGHVNKKAFEQYGIFTKQRDQLTTRKEELDTTAESIRGLVDSLDRRKNEAIERTFQQVASNFAEIFETLVPAGRGELVIERKPTSSSSDEAMEVDGGEATTTSEESYTGVSIKVSFNSKSDEGMIMQQLSGGQKSLVALALIFAIQKCDPAPFYLFDEIDANLDAQYRTAVAEMIHQMSAHGQFITTTFRPELLANADQFYGVTFQGKVSRIHEISKENALGFVEQEQAH
ncbi:chromosome segregation protein [Lichtheimia corymbifera JMRC:FSU:9682]|uniref:Structural maintenance of chromosomes protein n=1 Tax=Lichtheimia corymbifera JMRC:FSU:9682 TaxID=1263082 RepID=A0A068RHU5_9FUNG|nr:chromosome segregation protein [Lichtheimia corymbifera JMRC:FSU:9682]